MSVKELEVEFISLQSQFVELNSKIDNLLVKYENLGESTRKVKQDRKKQHLSVTIVRNVLKV